MVDQPRRNALELHLDRFWCDRQDTDIGPAAASHRTLKEWLDGWQIALA
jgi:hypothetical protein